MNESPDCTICARELWEDELGRHACKPCERRLDDRLRAFAGPLGLFAKLCLRNEAGAPNTEPRVSGSANASIAGSLNILNETAEGGFVTALEEWAADWAWNGIGVCGTGVRVQYRIDQAIANFRFNLTKACCEYPDIAGFAAAIDTYYRRYRAIVEGGRPPVTIPGICHDCGHGFRYGLFDDSADCRHCGRRHTRAELLQPPRTQAA